MAALLASADPVFNQQVQNLFQYLRVEKLAEYLYRLSYIILLAYLFAGVLLYALLSSSKERVTSTGALRLSPFLGWLEAVTVLACVDLLFVFFVAIQFRYFFGGQANINLEGFTYAAYARRGFGELLAVAFISLLLFLVLSWVTRRQADRSRRLFSAMGILLVALVAVILVSAFQRLLLYEAAYGFTRLRALYPYLHDLAGDTATRHGSLGMVRSPALLCPGRAPGLPGLWPYPEFRECRCLHRPPEYRPPHPGGSSWTPLTSPACRTTPSPPCSRVSIPTGFQPMS